MLCFGPHAGERELEGSHTNQLLQTIPVSTWDRACAISLDWSSPLMPPGSPKEQRNPPDKMSQGKKKKKINRYVGY